MPHNKRRIQRAALEFPANVLKPLEVADFFQTNVFTRAWERLGLTDDDLRALEIAIMTSPQGSPVMKGTGGLRKLRFAPSRWSRGKSGALRICYVYFEEYRLVLLVFAYPKGEREDLSPEGRKAAKEIIAQQRAVLAQRRTR